MRMNTQTILIAVTIKEATAFLAKRLFAKANQFATAVIPVNKRLLPAAASCNANYPAFEIEIVRLPARLIVMMALAHHAWKELLKYITAAKSLLKMLPAVK